MTQDEFRSIYEKVPVVELSNSVVQTPLVSICVQTYQHGDFIEDCLNGIIEQVTDFPFEVLLGEDGSKDKTRSICLRYAKRYPDKIRLFLHDRRNNIFVNGHPTGRFNFLNNIYKSNGKYIALCEGDDFWTDSSKLQRQFEYLQRNESCHVCGSGWSISDSEGNRTGAIIFPEVYRYNFADVMHGRAKYRTCTLLIRKDKIDWNKLTNPVLMGDKLLMLNLLYSGGYAVNLPLNMATYRVHSGGLWSGKKKNLKIRDYYFFFKDHFQDLFPGHDLHVEILVKQYGIKLFAQAVRELDFKNCMEYARYFSLRPIFLKTFLIQLIR